MSQLTISHLRTNASGGILKKEIWSKSERWLLTPTSEKGGLQASFPVRDAFLKVTEIRERFITELSQRT